MHKVFYVYPDVFLILLLFDGDRGSIELYGERVGEPGQIDNKVYLMLNLIQCRQFHIWKAFPEKLKAFLV